MYLVRPNLGSPLILKPEDLIEGFKLVFADKTEQRPDRYVLLHALMDSDLRLRRSDGSGSFGLTIHGAHVHQATMYNNPDGDWPVTAQDHQYKLGFRWEYEVRVRTTTPIDDIMGSQGWPQMFDIYFHEGNSRRTNYHAVYVHETLGSSNEFTVLHISDTHIARRNDQIPGLLCQVRNKEECEELASRYINFNDNLRAFIKLANERMRSGENVIVVLTGDIVDHYFDGWWDGKFVCGQGDHAPDRRKEATGSAWGYSNVSKFREIILGTDGKGEELLCPLFTVLGNHDYLMNEVLFCIQIYFRILLFKLTHDKNSFGSFRLSYNEAREYDYWAFPRKSGKHKSLAERKTFRENVDDDNWQVELDQDWSYWLAKPKFWQLSQYIRTVNYDTDFRFSIGDHQLLCLNTGQDRYPTFAEFGGWASKEDSDKDYISDGPHNRGIIAEHLTFVQQAIADAPEHGLVLIFSHAPLVSLHKDKTVGMDVLFEKNHEQAPPLPNEVSAWLSDVYGKSWTDLRSSGFPLTDTKYFYSGKRDPLLNFSCADGDAAKLLDLINGSPGSSTKPRVIVFSGHTHKVHEFRVEKVGNDFRYFLDDYSGDHFQSTTDDSILASRYDWQMENSPLLATSGALKKERNQYREIIVKDRHIVSLEMKELPHIESTASFAPGCRDIALRTHNSQYVRAESAGGGRLVANSNRIKEWETFEIIELEGNNVALKAHNGRFARAENGGGGRLKADRTWIKSHETFELISISDNKVVLRSNNGKYLRAETDGGGSLLANGDRVEQWSTFELIELDKS